MTEPCRANDPSARRSRTDPSPAQDYEHCVTCSDEAVVVRVSRLLPFGLALVDPAGGGEAEEVSVALVDAAVGDTVLVHAKEALAVLSQDAVSPAASPAASPSVCAISGAVDEVYETGSGFRIGAAGEAD